MMLIKDAPPSQTVDILFKASDGKPFYDSVKAEAYAKDLKNKEIIAFVKDPEVRKAAEKSTWLKSAVFATDYLKTCKYAKIVGSYEAYHAMAKSRNIDVVTEQLFRFISSKVYSSNKPVIPGQSDHIYMFETGITPAVFLRRYDSGQLWQVADKLVLTCPTNTELGQVAYRDLFPTLIK